MKDEVMDKLKARYFNLVKKGLEIQKKGDIKAFISNAIETEQIAQEMQQLSRTK